MIEAYTIDVYTKSIQLQTSTRSSPILVIKTNLCYFVTFQNNLTNFVNKWVKVDELKSFLKLSLLIYVGSSLCGTAM